MNMPKIGFIGAGNIGGTAALLACVSKLGRVVLFDIHEGTAKGKALDIAQSLPIQNVAMPITGTSNTRDLEGCDVVIITAGSPRKPGMSRDDLIEVNTNVMRSCADIVTNNCPKAFCIIVTNPLDAMVWAFAKSSGLPKHMVVGMAGILDTARYRHFLGDKLACDPCQIQALVLGGHGDSMVPLPSYTTVGGIPLKQLVARGELTDDEHEAIITRTRMGGGEIVGLLGNGSAYHAPAAATLQMARAFLYDEKKTLPCAGYHEDIFGISDIYAGLPVTIDASGVTACDVPELTPDEKTALIQSLKDVRTLCDRVETFLN